MSKLFLTKPLATLLGAALFLTASTGDLHARPVRPSNSSEKALLARILAFSPVQAALDLFSSAWEKNGSPLGQDGREGDHGAELDPDGSQSTGDNGAELDPNG